MVLKRANFALVKSIPVPENVVQLVLLKYKLIARSAQGLQSIDSQLVVLPLVLPETGNTALLQIMTNFERNRLLVLSETQICLLKHDKDGKLKLINCYATKGF